MSSDETPAPETIILRVQDPNTGEVVLFVLRLGGGTIEATATEE